MSRGGLYGNRNRFWGSEKQGFIARNEWSRKEIFGFKAGKSMNRWGLGTTRTITFLLRLRWACAAMHKRVAENPHATSNLLPSDNSLVSWKLFWILRKRKTKRRTLKMEPRESDNISSAFCFSEFLY